MRLFVSLPLDEPMRRHLGAIARAVVIDDREHDVGWVAPQNLHVTLKFLGDVADADVPAVTEALRRAMVPGPVQIAAGVPEPARHRGRVHVIAAEIRDAEGKLTRLHDAIDHELASIGFAREKRAFWPHVTIGRSRRGVRLSPERVVSGDVGVIDRFELMSSTLRPGGPLYVPVASYPLAGTSG